MAIFIGQFLLDNFSSVWYWMQNIPEYSILFLLNIFWWIRILIIFKLILFWCIKYSRTIVFLIKCLDIKTIAITEYYFVTLSNIYYLKINF